MEFVIDWTRTKKSQFKRVPEFWMTVWQNGKKPFIPLLFYLFVSITLIVTIIAATLRSSLTWLVKFISNFGFIEETVAGIAAGFPILQAVLAVIFGTTLVISLQRFFIIRVLNRYSNNEDTHYRSAAFGALQHILSLLIFSVFFVILLGFMFGVLSLVCVWALAQFGFFVDLPIEVNLPSRFLSVNFLLLLFSIYLYIKTIFVYHEIAIEGRSFIGAFKHSLRLTKKQYWSGAMVGIIYYPVIVLISAGLIYSALFLTHEPDSFWKFIFEHIRPPSTLEQITPTFFVLVFCVALYSASKHIITLTRYKKQVELNGE